MARGWLGGKDEDLLISASFTYVARSKEGTAVQVPRLHVDGDEEDDSGADLLRLPKLGERNEKSREHSLQRMPPTEEELGIIHEKLMAEQGAGRRFVRRSRVDTL